MKTGRGVVGLTSGMKGAMAIAILLSLSTVMPSTANTGIVDQRADLIVNLDIVAEEMPLEGQIAEPTMAVQPVNVQDGGETPDPRVWVEGDFIISHDEPKPNYNNASSPSIAVTPLNEYTRSRDWDGSIHSVWHEMDEAGASEIHYSKTSKDMGGYPLEWTGEHEDRTISYVRKGRALDNARDASINVDALGIIHVTWSQQYADDTWEIHYARSENNGKDWSTDAGQTPGEDIRISHKNRGAEATSPPKPSIAIGTNWAGKAIENPLYVVWAENYYGEAEEVHFSRSFNGGINWTGSETGDQVLSNNTRFAYNPSITATGDHGEIVNVAWKEQYIQKAEFGDEIAFVRSLNYGTDKTWEEQIPISDPVDPPMPMDIGNVEMASGRHDLHIIWQQSERGGKAAFSGIFYSFNDGGAWKTIEAQVDRPDGFTPEAPSVGVSMTLTKANPVEVQVVWSEFDETKGSMEIHNSVSTDPFNPESWSGLEKDNVISWPDGEEGCDAHNPSMVMGQIGGSWEPQIVWDEANNPKTKGFNRAQKNTEIHTLPPLTITASSGSYGSISPSGFVLVPNGDDQTFNFNPDPHYHVSDVVVDEVSVGSPSSYTFYNVNSDHTIYVSFSIDRFSLSTAVSPGGSGSVTKNPNWSTYPYGYVVELTANDNTGWDFSYWSGHASGSSNPYYITMYGYRSVTANFVVETNIITASAGTGGTITPSGSVVVNYGDDKTFIIAASAGYAIKDVLVDSASQGAMPSYTFLSVTTTHTIEAQFIPEYTQSLSTGWNRVSFPLIQSDTSIETVLDSIDSYWDEARYYDALGEDWDTYENGVGGDLANVNHTMGFWVHVTGSCTLTVTGNRPSSTIINLYTGWNMIGYPAENDGSYDIADLKSDVTAVQLVYKEDWRYLMTELADTYVLQNGELYWVFVDSDTTWTVNW